MLNSIYLALLIFLKPLKDKLESIMTIANYALSTFMYLSMLVLTFIGSWISEKYKNIFFGNFMIFLVCASVLFNIGIGAWITIKVIIVLIRSFKAKESQITTQLSFNKNTQIHPEKTENPSIMSNKMDSLEVIFKFLISSLRRNRLSRRRS